MGLDFDLAALDCELTMDLSMILEGTDTILRTDVDAVGVINWPAIQFRRAFVVASDASDVTDADEDDLLYFMRGDKFLTTIPASDVGTAAIYNAEGFNPVNASVSVTTGDEADGRMPLGDAGKNFVRHDMLRYIALKLFNTPKGLDLVDNELDVVDALQTVGAETWATTRTAVIGGAGTQNTPLTNANAGDNNVVKKCFDQIKNSAPGRLTRTDGSPMHGLGNATVAGEPKRAFYCPFEEGDTINFQITINAPEGQNTLTGVDAIPSRKYRIKIVLVDNEELPLSL